MLTMSAMHSVLIIAENDVVQRKLERVLGNIHDGQVAMMCLNGYPTYAQRAFAFHLAAQFPDMEILIRTSFSVPASAECM